MGRKKKEVPTKVVDTRSEAEKRLDSLVIKMRYTDLTSEEKRELESVAAQLDAEGKTHEFSGIGKFYSVQFDGEEEYETFRLVGSNPKISRDIPKEERELSISSPLGNAVRNLKVGETSSYKVLSDNLKFTLVAVAGTYEELPDKVKQLRRR
jgi:transcription elongation GreA/GreB family factor